MTALSRYKNAQQAHEEFFLNSTQPQELTNSIHSTFDLENLNSCQRIKFIAGIIQKLGQEYLDKNGDPGIKHRYLKDILHLL